MWWPERTCQRWWWAGQHSTTWIPPPHICNKSIIIRLLHTMFQLPYSCHNQCYTHPSTRQCHFGNQSVATPVSVSYLTHISDYRGRFNNTQMAFNKLTSRSIPRPSSGRNRWWEWAGWEWRGSRQSYRSTSGLQEGNYRLIDWLTDYSNQFA